jgi:hypothetical protein
VAFRRTQQLGHLSFQLPAMSKRADGPIALVNVRGRGGADIEQSPA